MVQYFLNVGNFIVSSCEDEDLKGENKLWLIANSTATPRLKRVLHNLNGNQRLFLEAGNIIKIGKTELLVSCLRLYDFQTTTNSYKEDSCILKYDPMYTPHNKDIEQVKMKYAESATLQ